MGVAAAQMAQDERVWQGSPRKGQQPRSLVQGSRQRHALHTGDSAFAATLLRKAHQRDLPLIKCPKHGILPLEAARTRSFHYVLFSGEALARLGELARHKKGNVASEAKALASKARQTFDSVKPFAAGEKRWDPYQQKGGDTEGSHNEDVRRTFALAAGVYQDRSFASVYRKTSASQGWNPVALTHDGIY